MATEKLEELTIDQLRKKNKGLTRLLIILVIVWIIVFIGMFIVKSHSALIFIPVSFVTMLPLFLGLFKIRAELKKRENPV